jgi:carbonic anhydrase/acetyltransferase-like protein (isoleucine patch superfamily)
MQIKHRGVAPTIDPTARVAPNATICGDVTIGPNTSIGFGAVITAESGPVRIGANCVVMDTAVIRGVRNNPVTIGNNVLVGPRAYLVGCTIEDEVFLATGSTVFNGAHVGKGAEVRINGIVHLRTVLPPDKHDDIWAIQKGLDLPRYVFGVDRPPPGETIMPTVMPRYAGALRHWHQDDEDASGDRH